MTYISKTFNEYMLQLPSSIYKMLRDSMGANFASDINYLDIEIVDDKVMCSYLPKNRIKNQVNPYNCEGRQCAKLGKVLKQLFRDKWTDGQIESAVCELKNLMVTPPYKFSIITGEDILAAYHPSSHHIKASSSSTLGTSCMSKEHISHFMELYAKNPNAVSLVTAWLQQEGEHPLGLVARALYWNGQHKDKPVKILDRIYYRNEIDAYHLAKQYPHDIYYYLPVKKLIDVTTDLDVDGDITVNLDNVEMGAFPYVDSFPYLSIRHKKLHHKLPLYDIYELRSQHGEYTYKEGLWDDPIPDGYVYVKSARNIFPIEDTHMLGSVVYLTAELFTCQICNELKLKETHKLKSNLHDNICIDHFKRTYAGIRSYTLNDVCYQQCCRCKINYHIDTEDYCAVCDGERFTCLDCNTRYFKVPGYEKQYCQKCYKLTCDFCNEGFKSTVSPYINICPVCIPTLKLCQHCNVPQLEDDCELVQGGIVCIKCFHTYYIDCERCSRTVSNINVYNVNNHEWCPSCYDKHAFTCDGCGMAYDDEDDHECDELWAEEEDDGEYF